MKYFERLSVFAIRLLCAALLSAAAFGQDVGKSVAVVPRSGPVEGQTIYTGTFALFVGVGAFAQEGLGKIPSAPNDAKTLRDLLVEKFGFDPRPDHTVVLTDAEATKARIETELVRMCDPKRVKKTDRVFVFFSCHGQSVKTLDGESHGYLIPYDAQVNLEDATDPTGYQSTCIKMDDMIGRLGECPANHRVVVLDACFSGLAVTKDPLTPAPFDPSVVSDDLSERGLFVLTAGNGKEVTFGQADPNKLSLFTQAFVDALTECAQHGQAAFMEQIAADAVSRTTEASRGQQKPQPVSKVGVGSMVWLPAGASVQAIAGGSHIAKVSAKVAAPGQVADLPSWAVVDFRNRKQPTGTFYGRTAAEAVSSELAKSGRVDLIAEDTVARVIMELGIRNPPESKVNLLRVAQDVRATIVVSGDVLDYRIVKTSSGRKALVKLSVVMFDVASGVAVNSAVVEGESLTRIGDVADEELMNDALGQAASIAVGQILRRKKKGT